MKKLKILCLLLLVLLTTSCGQKEEVINIPTAATSGNLYPLGAALANLYNDKIPGIKACNQASNGGLDNLHLMERKEVQLTFGVSNIVYDAYMGQGLFQGHANKDLRVIAGLYYNPNQIVVRADRGIESLEDLKGHAFAPGSPGTFGSGPGPRPEGPIPGFFRSWGRNPQRVLGRDLDYGRDSYGGGNRAYDH